MFLNRRVRHYRPSVNPPEGLTVYVDDGVPAEVGARADVLGQPPFNYDNLRNARALKVWFEPPLSQEEKDTTFGEEAIARAMGVGSLAMEWTTRPSRNYGQADLEILHVTLPSGLTWERPQLDVFLNAVEAAAIA